MSHLICAVNGDRHGVRHFYKHRLFVADLAQRPGQRNHTLDFQSNTTNDEKGT
jgi:hypothetical protein